MQPCAGFRMIRRISRERGDSECENHSHRYPATNGPGKACLSEMFPPQMRSHCTEWRCICGFFGSCVLSGLRAQLRQVPRKTRSARNAMRMRMYRQKKICHKRLRGRWGALSLRPKCRSLIARIENVEDLNYKRRRRKKHKPRAYERSWSQTRTCGMPQGSR